MARAHYSRWEEDSERIVRDGVNLTRGCSVYSEHCTKFEQVQWLEYRKDWF
jgi:hypothetical protein